MYNCLAALVSSLETLTKQQQQITPIQVEPADLSDEEILARARMILACRDLKQTIIINPID